jgi:hypothetical protein
VVTAKQAKPWSVVIDRQVRHACHRHVNLRRSPTAGLSREPCTIDPASNDPWFA